MESRDVAAIGAATAGTGAALTATVASACCVGPALAPVFLSVLGASGLAAATELRPYSPWLLIASALMLVFSFRQAYRQPPCAAGGAPIPTPPAARTARAVTWIAAALWIASASYSMYGFLHE
jgi:hypothetical protein